MRIKIQTRIPARTFLKFFKPVSRELRKVNFDLSRCYNLVVLTTL